MLCDHKFEFLRSGKMNVHYERNPIWLHFDVFFCSRCLTYKNVPTRASTPSSESFYREVEYPLAEAVKKAGGRI